MAPVVAKSLSRLSRDSLIELCLRWSQSDHSTPYLTSNRNLLESDEEDYLHEPLESTAELRQLYRDIQGQENEKDTLSKKDIIDRIVDGDWRRGLSLQQLADIDFANLEQNDTALRWSALKLVPYKSARADGEEEESTHPAKKRKTSHGPPRQVHYPSIAPANFVASLKSHISPLVKAHYTIHRLSSPSKLVVVRLYIVPNTPFAPVNSNIPRNVRQATDTGRVMYIALPDSCPYVYVALSGSAGKQLASKPKDKNSTPTFNVDITAMKRMVLESIPKAMSKPQERWSLENTKLTCRSLKAIGLLRGNSRPGTAGGCYSKFSEEYEWRPSDGVQSAVNSDTVQHQSQTSVAEHTPVTIPQPPRSTVATEAQSKHAEQVSLRFGSMTAKSHAKLDRFHVTLSNILAVPPTSKPKPIPNPAPQQSHTARKPKRKRRSLEDIEAGRDDNDNNTSGTSVDETEQTTKTTTQEPAQITMNFSGSDVFRGLKELALFDNGRFVDLERMPSWTTGEKGVSGLVV